MKFSNLFSVNTQHTEWFVLTSHSQARLQHLLDTVKSSSNAGDKPSKQKRNPYRQHANHSAKDVSSTTDSILPEIESKNQHVHDSVAADRPPRQLLFPSENKHNFMARDPEVMPAVQETSDQMLAAGACREIGGPLSAFQSDIPNMKLWRRFVAEKGQTACKALGLWTNPAPPEPQNWKSKGSAIQGFKQEHLPLGHTWTE